MDIKSTPPVNRGTTQSGKGNAKTPTRSFKEVMACQARPAPSRKKNVFDLASKEKKKNSTDAQPHHGEHAKEVQFQGVGEGIEVPEVHELSLEMSSLIEEMSHYVTMESQGGVSRTTVTLGMEGSIFDGSEIIIDHYDTAPHSFNLLLIGNPEAANLFTAHLGALQTSLSQHEALKGFHIQLLHPALTEKSDLHLRGKSRTERKKMLNPKGMGETPSSISKK